MFMIENSLHAVFVRYGTNELAVTRRGFRRSFPTSMALNYSAMCWKITCVTCPEHLLAISCAAWNVYPTPIVRIRYDRSERYGPACESNANPIGPQILVLWGPLNVQAARMTLGGDRAAGMVYFAVYGFAFLGTAGALHSFVFYIFNLGRCWYFRLRCQCSMEIGREKVVET